MVVKPAKRGTSKAAATQRKRLFVEAFITNGENATQAYKAAGYTAKNDHVAGTEGHKLLKDPEIHRIIEERRAALRQRFSLTTDRVMHEMARIAYFDPRKLLDDKGKPLELHKVDDDTAAGLHFEMVPDKNGNLQVTRVRMVAASAKNASIEKAAKVLKIYETPPPPPPGDAEVVDMNDAARRIAFALAVGEHAVARASTRARPRSKEKKRQPA